MAAYLIDFENVKSDGIKGILQLSEEDSVIIFYSHNADTLTFETMDMIFAAKANVRKYKIVRVGKNSLDFQLSTYLGWLIRDGKDSNFFIISKDNGFQHVMEFWKKSFGFEGYVFCCPTIGDAYMKLKRLESISARERQKAIEEEEREELSQAFAMEAEEEAETAFEETEGEISQEERVFVESDDEIDDVVSYRGKTAQTEQERPGQVENRFESSNNPKQEAKPAVRQDARQDERRHGERRQDGRRTEFRNQNRKEQGESRENEAENLEPSKPRETMTQRQERDHENEHGNRQNHRKDRFERRENRHYSKDNVEHEIRNEVSVRMDIQAEAVPAAEEKPSAAPTPEVKPEDVRVISQDDFMTAVVHDDGPKKPAVPKEIHQERRTVVDSHLAEAIAAAVPDDGFRVTAVENNARVHAVAEPETAKTQAISDSKNTAADQERVKAEETVKEQTTESRSHRSHHRRRTANTSVQSEQSAANTVVEEPAEKKAKAEPAVKEPEAAAPAKKKTSSAKKKAVPADEEKTEAPAKPKTRTKKTAAKKAVEAVAETAVAEKAAEPVKDEAKAEEQPAPKKTSRSRSKKAAAAKEPATAPAEASVVSEVKQTRRQGRRPKPKTSEAAEFMTE